jgi:hypothetical protein
MAMPKLLDHFPPRPAALPTSHFLNQPETFIEPNQSSPQKNIPMKMHTPDVPTGPQMLFNEFVHHSPKAQKFFAFQINNNLFTFSYKKKKKYLSNNFAPTEFARSLTVTKHAYKFQ